MKRSGFTLIEVILTLGITVIIFAALSIALNTVLSTARSRTGQAAQIEQATRVIDYVVHTIREAQPSAATDYPIAAASTSSVTVYTTISGNIIAKVRFFVSGTELRQGIILPSGSPATYPAGNETITTILRGVQASATPLFNYYTGSYTGTQAAIGTLDATTIRTIRLVQMNVTFDPDTLREPGPMTISMNAQLRNLKDN